MKIWLAYLVLLCSHSFAQSTDIAGKANAFLASLSESLKSKAQYKLNDDERLNWHFVPRTRNGVSFGEFNQSQRAAALDLIKVSLSAQGFNKVTEIMALENILREVESRGPDDKYRDPLNYYLTIFGVPNEKTPWGWRLEGHHIALNFSSLNNAIESSTPSFFGSNPATISAGREKGKQVLRAETALGFELVNSLTSTQLKTAVISETPLNEIVSYNVRKAEKLSPSGLKYTDLNTSQKNIFMKLLDVYIKNYELGFSQKLMEKIKKSGIDKLSFAWAGSLLPGSGYYYRIQGPMLLIELDNTQNNANHVHSVVRDLTNDFGEDILREHYEREHSKK